jgi:hypothetical protein
MLYMREFAMSKHDDPSSDAVTQTDRTLQSTGIDGVLVDTGVVSHDVWDVRNVNFSEHEQMLLFVKGNSTRVGLNIERADFTR